MKDAINFIVIHKKQVTKSPNLVVICNSYSQCCERIQEYLDSEFISFGSDEMKRYKTTSGNLVDVFYDFDGLATGYSYDGKVCSCDNITLDSKVYDFLMRNKNHDIENLFNGYINSDGDLNKSDIIDHLNKESSKWYRQPVYSDVIDFEKMVESNEEIKTNQ
jgi:hypothetical protein